MLSKGDKLNLLIGALALVLVGLILRGGYGRIQKQTEEERNTARYLTQTELMEADTSRILDGEMPINWEENAPGVQRQTSRQQRIKERAAGDRAAVQNLNAVDFERIRTEQLKAMEKKAAASTNDTQSNQLTVEQLQTLKAEGRAVW